MYMNKDKEDLVVYMNNPVHELGRGGYGGVHCTLITLYMNKVKEDVVVYMNFPFMNKVEEDLVIHE